MQCAQCSTPVPDQAKYCHNCGSLVSDAEGQASATASMDSSALRHVEKLLREDTKGEFEIERLLGKGGMALVYLGKEVRLGRRVAIKVLPPELTFGHGVQRFMREARTAAALDHPQIIPIHRVSSGEQIFWYAMKYLEGQSLEDVLHTRKRLPLDETIRILSQVADALDYAHEHGVIHRDVKPANVMLDARQRVVVTDFGIAKALAEGTLTASGSVIGTPFYMSPEQALGIQVSGRSDQYSLGVMTYRMLSGQVPFDGIGSVDILQKHCTQLPPPLDVIQTGLPWYVYRAVHRALEKTPANRFATVSEFVAALREPSPGLVETSEAKPPATLPSPPRVSATAVPETPGLSRLPELPPSRVSTKQLAPPRARAAARLPRYAALGMTGVLVVAGTLWLSGAFGRRDTPQRGPPVDSSGVRLGSAATVPAFPEPVAVASDSPPARPPQQVLAVPRTGRVTVTGLPRGGSVLADGRRQRGTTFELGPGRHQIRMEAAGYEVTVESVTVAAGGTATVAFSGTVRRPAAPAPAAPAPPASVSVAQDLAYIIVRVSPSASVSIDGENRGVRPLVVDTVIPGAHSLRVSRDGFTTLDTTVTVGAGDTSRVVIQLKRTSPP